MTGIKKGCEFGDGQKWCISFLKKKNVRSETNEVLTQNLHKAVIEKFKRWKVYLRFKYNIWTTDLSEMRSLSSNNPFFTEYASWFYWNSK